MLEASVEHEFSLDFRGICSLVFKYFCLFAPNTHCALVVSLSEKKQAPFNMVRGNEELEHECFSKHSRMGTAIMKQDEATEEGKKRKVRMERSKAGT